MPKITLLRISLFFSVLLLTVQAYAATVPMTQTTAADLDMQRFLRMTDNFIVIFDPSQDMDVSYRESGKSRLEVAKEIIGKSQATLPELNWQAGLYGNWKGGLWLHGSPMAFEPYFPLGNYEHATFAEAIESLPTKPTGPAMMQRGLMKVNHLLGIDGRTEIFFFSNGHHTTEKGLEPEPLQEAKEIAAQHDVCFNIISSAETAEEKQLLADIAAVNSCSQVLDFDTLADKPEHLFGKLFMDRDLPNVLFDFDKSFIKEEFKPTLDTLGRYLQEHPNSYGVLSGFTCNIGTEKYNKGLSKRRAESVRNYLQNRFGIEAKRMLLYWYGYANPVASNATEKGRRLNRRVTIKIRNQETAPTR